LILFQFRAPSFRFCLAKGWETAEVRRPIHSVGNLVCTHNYPSDWSVPAVAQQVPCRSGAFNPGILNREKPLSDNVRASEAAARLIRRLQELHGPLLLHLSSGCCDGTAPTCLRQGDFRLGSSDVMLGNVEGVPFYAGPPLAPLLAYAELSLDVIESQSDSFSLEAGDGLRFIVYTLNHAGQPCCPRK